MDREEFLAEWNRTEVSTASPTDQVFVTISGVGGVRVRFASGYFERVAAAHLQRELIATARQAVRDYSRAYFALCSLDAGHLVEPRREAVNPAGAEYLARFAEIAAEGWSGDGTIGVFGVGMREFTMVYPGSVQRTMTGEEFAWQLGEAATAYMQDQLAKVAAVQYDIYWKPYLEPTA